MNQNRVRLGRQGENLAATALERCGYTLVARNWRCQLGEVDLIARRGEEWSFFEVRTRRGSACGTPEESITPRKRARMEAVARQYLAEQAPWADPLWHLGFVAIEMDAQGHLLRISVYPDLESDGWTLSLSSLLSDRPR